MQLERFSTPAPLLICIGAGFASEPARPRHVNYFGAPAGAEMAAAVHQAEIVYREPSYRETPDQPGAFPERRYHLLFSSP